MTPAVALLALSIAIAAPPGFAQAAAPATGPATREAPPTPAPVGRLCRARLTTDVEPDMTSIESVVRSIIRPGMTDEEKCMALYWFVHDHRYWYPSFYPVENSKPVADPVLIVNCYPALICQNDATVTTAFWAAAGFDVRYWQLGGHTTGEVFYGGKWRNFDATSGRFVRDQDGGVGGVDLSQRFYKPDKSRVEPFDDFEIGHEMNFSLRKGETFTRYWSPLGDGPDFWRPSNTKDKRADNRPGHRLGLDAAMSRKPYRFDHKGSGVANGLLTFTPDVREKGWETLFDKADSVAADAAGMISPAEGKTGELVWRVYIPWTITGAFLEGEFAVGSGGEIKASVSADNGSTWKDLGAVAAGRQKIPLREQVAGEFGYLVKLTLKGPRGTGVTDLTTSTIVQLNPLSLPALKNGRTAIHLAAGEQLETITIDPDLNAPGYRSQIAEESNTVISKEISSESWVCGLRAKEPGKESTIVYKVTAPGDVRQVRWGGRFKVGAGCVNEMLYSTDGKTWKKQELSGRWIVADSPARKIYRPFNETTADWPPGTRTVWLKYRFIREQGEPVLMTALRVDVDYAPPGASLALPVEVTYCWEEEEAPAAPVKAGDPPLTPLAKSKLVEKTATEVVRRLPFSWSINVGGPAKPMMKWVRMRLYDGKAAPAVVAPAAGTPTPTPRPAKAGEEIP
ncbi:MAG: hypothetical protein ACE15C_05175 [Phycisphaerae bacterium]